MEGADVLEILHQLQSHGIDVWLNGGWGVDALLGCETRAHEDLDITISSAKRDAYNGVMEQMGFTLHRVDNEFNWVMGDDRGRLVDVHLVDFETTTVAADGKAVYGPKGLPFEVGALDGNGIIGGASVRCEAAEFQVRGHTGYEVDEQDYRDVLALCTRFEIPVPETYVERGLHLRDAEARRRSTE